MATLPQWIEARVIQKIATEAEWNEITLVPYKGEVCLVGDSGGKVVNIKIGDGINTFPNLDYMFDSIQQNAQYVPITSNALPTPVADPAWGMVTEGTYTFGGVDVFTVPDGHWGIANYISGTWSLVDMGELPAAPPVTKEIIQEFAYTKDEYVPVFLQDTAEAYSIAVDDVPVTDPLLQKEYLKKLDQSIKQLSVFGIPKDVFIGIRQFGYNPLGTGNMSIGFIQLPDEVNDHDVNYTNIAFREGQYDYSKPYTIAIRQRYSSFSVVATFDMSVFGDEKVIINFRSPSGISNYRKLGLKNGSIQYIPVKSFWGLKYGLQNNSANVNPEALWINQAIKSITLKSDENALVRLNNINYNTTSGNIQFVIPYCADDDNDNLVVNASRNRSGFLRINIPLSTDGVHRAKSYVLTGPMSSLEMDMVIDMTMLKENIPYIATNNISVGSTDETAHWIVKPGGGGGTGILTSLTMVDGEGDFQGNFRFAPATANWVLSGAFNMTKLTRIPENTETIDFLMSFNGGHSNALYLDKNMKMLSWAYVGSEEITNLTSVPPEGAVFILASTTTPSSTAKIIAKGVFEKNSETKEYRSIHEGLADKHSGNLFMVKDIVFKKHIDGLCTLKEYEVLSPDWLDDVRELEKDGDFIIPTGVLHTNGTTSFNGGTLCSIKDGVMYFYNARECAVFKSEDDGATFTVISDKFSHPSIWDSETTNNEARSAVIPLDNGEILFPIRVRGEVINPEESPNRSRYWTLYRTTGNQSDIEKCFEFSWESTYNRPWLPESDPQYTWPNHSGGCLLGNFTSYVHGNIVVITEYGQGTSAYWNERGVSNNARGISGRAWISMDNGVTWKKMFDADRKKVGTEEEDDNWYYFTDTFSAKSRHMHGVYIDEIRGVVHLTNGDYQDYDWAVTLEDLETWYASASTVNPNEKPEYKVTDTFPTWTSNLLAPGGDNSNYAYSAMKYQMMQGRPVKIGDVWGHDASREFAYISYENNGEYIFEPVFQFEHRDDFATEQAFVNSWGSTDAFVQGITVHNGVIYFTHSNGEDRPSRIYATKDGLSWKIVYEGLKSDVKFAGLILFDGNKIYLNDGTSGQDSRTVGFWRLKEK